MISSKLRCGIALAVIITGITVISIGRYFFFPDLKPLRNENPTTTSFIRYRERQWKAEKSDRTVSLRWVPYNRISPNLIKAVVVSEDAKFWRHHGFDFAEIKNALQTNLNSKRIRFGASTISQQLVKNLYLRPSKNVFRKIAEAILTWRLERTLSKKRILEIYLNVVEWGDGIFGIRQAARHYFGKSPGELTAEEASLLAVVLPSPRRYDPLSKGGFIERRAAVIRERAFPAASISTEVDSVAEPPEVTASAAADTAAVTDSAATGIIDSGIPATPPSLNDSVAGEW